MSDGVEPPFAFTLPWRSQSLTFAYGIDQVRALQRTTGFGPWLLEARIGQRHCQIEEIEATLVQGLVGGGMKLAAAETLVRANIADTRHLEEARVCARAALAKMLYEIDGDLLGES